MKYMNGTLNLINTIYSFLDTNIFNTVVAAYHYFAF